MWVHMLLRQLIDAPSQQRMLLGSRTWCILQSTNASKMKFQGMQAMYRDMINTNLVDCMLYLVLVKEGAGHALSAVADERPTRQMHIIAHLGHGHEQFAEYDGFLSLLEWGWAHIQTTYGLPTAVQ